MASSHFSSYSAKRDLVYHKRIRIKSHITDHVQVIIAQGLITGFKTMVKNIADPQPVPGDLISVCRTDPFQRGSYFRGPPEGFIRCIKQAVRRGDQVCPFRDIQVGSVRQSRDPQDL